MRKRLGQVYRQWSPEAEVRGNGLLTRCRTKPTFNNLFQNSSRAWFWSGLNQQLTLEHACRNVHRIERVYLQQLYVWQHPPDYHQLVEWVCRDLMTASHPGWIPTQHQSHSTVSHHHTLYAEACHLITITVPLLCGHSHIYWASIYTGWPKKW